MAVIVTPKNKNHLRRYLRIQQLFKRLYEEERRRIDDVYSEIDDVYCIERDRVNTILRMEIPEID